MKKILAFSFCIVTTSCTMVQNVQHLNTASGAIFSSEVIIDLMKKVADYQLANPSHHNSKSKDFPMGWIPASFYSGVMALYETSKDEQYLNEAIKWGESNNWQTAPRLGNADDIACGQIYLEIYQIKKYSVMIQPIKAVIDSFMTISKSGREEWWWCDALFMAPPVFARLGTITQEKKYFKFMHKMFWDTAQFLFSKEDGLFYRDNSYFHRRTKNGQKVFWSRGNGWVMAGIARVLQYLPEEDTLHFQYIKLYQTMASSVARAQGEDGFWHSSLLDAEEFPQPETSGTAFFCFALAYGINNDYLGRDIYLPIVKKAWQALTHSIHPNGKIGWVQKIGKKPGKVTYDDTHAYGAGGFLLAGSEVIKLIN
ncbi:MAG: glycoside hydrolase family 88 protein [bacterium]|nr:MAG: glycoside hydrolase family 88 protein [bacterium]